MKQILFIFLILVGSVTATADSDDRTEGRSAKVEGSCKCFDKPATQDVKSVDQIYKGLMESDKTPSLGNSKTAH